MLMTCWVSLVIKVCIASLLQILKKLLCSIYNSGTNQLAIIHTMMYVKSIEKYHLDICKAVLARVSLVLIFLLKFPFYRPLFQSKCHETL